MFSEESFHNGKIYSEQYGKYQQQETGDGIMPKYLAAVTWVCPKAYSVNQGCLSHFGKYHVGGKRILTKLFLSKQFGHGSWFSCTFGTWQYPGADFSGSAHLCPLLWAINCNTEPSGTMTKPAAYIGGLISMEVLCLHFELHDQASNDIQLSKWKTILEYAN